MRTLIFFILAFLLLWGPNPNGQTWAASLSPTSIILENAVHFLDADGSDVTVSPGTYEVESAEEWVRLVPGERRDALLIEADRQTHALEIDSPLAMGFPGDTKEEADLHFVMLLLPDGQSLEATGTYSGIRPRGFLGNALKNAKKTANNAHKKAKTASSQAAAKAKQAAQEAQKQASQAAAKANQAAKQAQQEAQNKANEAAAKVKQGAQTAKTAALQAKQEVEKKAKEAAAALKTGLNAAKKTVAGLIAPPPRKIRIPNFPFFNLFQGTFEPNLNRNSQDHSYVNSYLLGFASLFVYEPDLVPCPFPKDCWPEWQQAFRELFAKGGMTQFHFIKEPLTNTQVAVMSNNQVVVVVFRGSEKNVQDWLQIDANFPLIPVPQWGTGVMAHNGFHAAMRSVFTRVRSAIQAQNPRGTKRVWLTGHSLGGALAFLHAQAFARETPIQIQGVHTYGAPRVGNPLWNRAYNSRLRTKTQRWVNNADFVPLLVHPVGTQTQQVLSYQHVGLVHNIRANGSIRLNDQERPFPVKSYSTGDHNLLGYICPMVSHLSDMERSRLPQLPDCD